MYQGQPATQAPVAPAAPVQEPVPVAPVKESKSNKTSIIIACVAIILALAGMGFGVYEFIQERVKADEVSKLKRETNSLREQVAAYEAIDPADYLYLSDYGIKVKSPEAAGLLEESQHLEMAFSGSYDAETPGSYIINITDAAGTKANSIEYVVVDACDGTKEKGASNCFGLNDLTIIVRVADTIPEELKEFFINEKNYSLI